MKFMKNLNAEKNSSKFFNEIFFILNFFSLFYRTKSKQCNFYKYRK